MNRKTWIIVLIALLAIGIGAGCLLFIDLDGTAKNNIAASTVPTNTSTPTREPQLEEKVVLYFSSDNANFLSAENRIIEVKDREDLPLYVVKELIKGPRTTGLSTSVNEGTQVNSIKIDNKIATVDFSESLVALNTGGSTKEAMCLYSIVNSLCELPSIEKVIFSVEGKTLETFGQFDMADPYTKNFAIIKQ